MCKHFITTKLAYELKVRANLALLLLQFHRGWIFVDPFQLSACRRPSMWVVKARNSQGDSEPATSNLHTTSSAARNRWTTTVVQFNQNCGSWPKTDASTAFSLLPWGSEVKNTAVDSPSWLPKPGSSLLLLVFPYQCI